MPRKRLTPANPFYLELNPHPEGPGETSVDTPPTPRARAPIADVAADASATASLRALSEKMAQARASGRMVLELPLEAIALDHLVRDRVVLEDGDLQTLAASIKERGQQTPIEVMALSEGRYGLISGWRRCQAIAHLARTGTGPGTVLALLRQPEDAQDAYQAMVEENEIRVGLSYFERARIALKAVEAGVFDTEKAALLAMFQSASRAKRSKIRSFLIVVQTLDGHLRYPAALGERLGLALSKQLGAAPDFAALLHQALQRAQPTDAAAEQAVLQETLQQALTQANSPSRGASKGKATPPSSVEEQVREGLTLRRDAARGRIEISGDRVDAAFHARLRDWLAANG